MGLRIPSPSPALSNPQLAFQLDPGEPGVLRRAPASQSTLRVAEQEGRNTRRLEADAVRAGRIVVSSTRQFTRTDVGSFNTTVSGRTTVQSVEPRPTPIDTAQAIADAQGAAEGAGPALVLPEIAPPEPVAVNPAVSLNLQGGGSIGLFNGGFRFASVETARLEQGLIAQQASIERALILQQGTVGDLDDPAAVAAARQDLADLRQQAQNIEQEINRLRLAQLANEGQQFARSLQEATQAETPTEALVPLGAGAGGGAESGGADFLDVFA